MMTAPNIAYPESILPRLQYQYCPMCTASLVRGVINDDGISRVSCPACGWVHYPTNVTVVCALVKYEDKFVAILPSECPPEMPAACRPGMANTASRPNRRRSAKLMRKRAWW